MAKHERKKCKWLLGALTLSIKAFSITTFRITLIKFAFTLLVNITPVANVNFLRP